MNHPNPLQASPNRQKVDSERMTQYKEQRKRDLSRKCEEYYRNTARGVNIPQMSQAEMRKVRERLINLFKKEINPMMKEFQSKEDYWDNWQAFERVYEEAMDFLRLHIMKVLKLKSETMYGQRRINPQIQKARAKQSEILFTRQEIQRRLVKVKSMLEQLDEYQGESVTERRRQMNLVTELNEFVKLIAPDARREIFGDNDLDRIWTELNTSGDHRTRVIEWLEAKITDEIVKEFQGVAQRLQALRVQDTYQTSESAAMKRHINKREWPLCPIEKEKICKYFQETWDHRNRPSLKRSELHRFT
jgi:hypothetical protein